MKRDFCRVQGVTYGSFVKYLDLKKLRLNINKNFDNHKINAILFKTFKIKNKKKINLLYVEVRSPLMGFSKITCAYSVSFCI